MAKMLGKRQLPDSVKCRHILIATKDAQTGQPTLSDTTAKKRADSIAMAIESGSDFAVLAKQFSNDPGSKDKGGEYEFSAQQFTNLAKPFAEFIFYKTTGTKEVIKTDFGWHYIELLDQKKFETGYKIAYYAKTIEPSNETINNASTAAIQFSSISRDTKSFEKNVSSKKLLPRLADIRANDFSISGLGNARRLIKWVFENKKGSVSEPESIGDKYVVAIVNDIKQKGLMDAASAKTLVEPILKSQKKAQQIIEKIGNNRNLNAIASSFNVQVLRADSVSFASSFINGIGNEPKVLGTSFNSKIKGSTSNPIPGNSGVFIIQTESIYMRPSQNLEYIAKRSQVEQGQKGTITYRAAESFKKSAEVEDNRIRFY
jgi:peptidyl-prolyl cis-trans isomerase D